MENQVNKFAKHYRILGILYIVYGIMNLLILTFAFYALDAILSMVEIEQEAVQIIRTIGFPVGIAFAILFILSVVAGLAINPRNQGSKIFMLILGCLFLFSFPFGTALGVYVLVTFISEHNQNNITAEK